LRERDSVLYKVQTKPKKQSMISITKADSVFCSVLGAAEETVDVLNIKIKHDILQIYCQDMEKSYVFF